MGTPAPTKTMPKQRGKKKQLAITRIFTKLSGIVSAVAWHCATPWKQIKKCKQTKRRHFIHLKPQQRKKHNAILVTVGMAECMTQGSFHNDYETFFSHQHFGGDDLPPQLADTSLPVKTPRAAFLLDGINTVAQCRADIRRLIVCQVASEVYDTPVACKVASALDYHRSGTVHSTVEV